MEHHKLPFAHELEGDEKAPTDLMGAIKMVNPTALFGLSTQGQSFTKEVCEKMVQISKAQNSNAKPLIFALSNPTSKAECTAQQAYEWCDGEVVYASGSPMDRCDMVTSKGEKKTFVPGQGNNAYIFPGVGLAAILTGASTITDDDFYIAADALANQVTDEQLQLGCAYPPLSDIRDVSARIAASVASNIVKTGRATAPIKADTSNDQLLKLCKDFMYEPSYDRPLPPSAVSSFGSGGDPAVVNIGKTFSYLQRLRDQ